MVREGWTCPKCGRVYGPTWMECTRCNQQIDEETPRKKVPVPDLTPRAP